jgi:hypothetical protein
MRELKRAGFNWAKPRVMFLSFSPVRPDNDADKCVQTLRRRTETQAWGSFAQRRMRTYQRTVRRPS